MKKVIVISVAAIVCYAALGVAAGYLLPAKIEEAERRLPGIGAAISRIATDQLRVSERMRDITSQTLARGGSKIDEVSMMLGDPELNRLALTYLGADWSVQRSSFLGSVTHSRKLLKVQKEEKMDEKTLLNKKIKELENRKRSLQNRLKGPHRSSAERAWLIEFDDVERQLLAFRSSNTYREYIEKDNFSANYVEAKAKNEDELFKLASQYQTKTIGVLNQVMASRIAELRLEEAEPSRLRQRMSFFNIWPLKLICRMPVEEN